MQIPPEEFDQRWAETFSRPERPSMERSKRLAGLFAAKMAEGEWEYDATLTKYFEKRNIPVERLGQFTHRDPDVD